VRVSAAWGRIAEWRNPMAAALHNAITRLVPPALFLRASAETLGWRPPPSPLVERRLARRMA
jgi:hypothetical protein